MCARFTLRSSRRVKLKPRHNIAPSQQIVTLGDFGAGLETRFLQWGLIPSWSKEGKGFINARIETLTAKPSFSDSFRLRRCLILADGFFEWKRAGKEKRPFYFQLKDESPFAFAGIWDNWRNSGKLITSCAIITTEANKLVGEIHERMPAILLNEFHDAWLDSRTPRDELMNMLDPLPASEMKAHPVSTRVNFVENDSADLVTRVDTEVGQTFSLF